MSGNWRCLCCFSSNDEGLTANGDIAASVASERGAGAAAAVRGGSLLGDETPYRVHVDGFERAPGLGGDRPIVYTLTVTHGNVQWPIRRRFRQVATLHDKLVQGLERGAVRDGLPRPPPKVTVRSLLLGSQSREFLLIRSAELQAYLDRLLLLIPSVGQCQALRDFLCAVEAEESGFRGATAELGEELRTAESERLSRREALNEAPMQTEALDKQEAIAGVDLRERAELREEAAETRALAVSEVGAAGELEDSDAEAKDGVASTRCSSRASDTFDRVDSAASSEPQPRDLLAMRRRMLMGLR